MMAYNGFDESRTVPSLRSRSRSRDMSRDSRRRRAVETICERRGDGAEVEFGTPPTRRITHRQQLPRRLDEENGTRKRKLTRGTRSDGTTRCAR